MPQVGMMQYPALAIEHEEQLTQGLALDKAGRKHLLDTCGDFQGSVLSHLSRILVRPLR